MKKLRRILASLTLATMFLFANGSMSRVRADQTVGPQGQQESKSKGPSTSTGLTQAELDYLLWLFFMWLIWGY